MQFTKDSVESNSCRVNLTHDAGKLEGCKKELRKRSSVSWYINLGCGSNDIQRSCVERANIPVACERSATRTTDY